LWYFSLISHIFHTETLSPKLNSSDFRTRELAWTYNLEENIQPKSTCTNGKYRSTSQHTDFVANLDNKLTSYWVFTVAHRTRDIMFRLFSQK